MDERPGCVTVYVILMFLVAALLVVAAFKLPETQIPQKYKPLLFAGAVLQVVIGIGLWRMKSWGLWLLVFVMSAGAIFDMYLFINNDKPIQIVQLVVKILILSWFIGNRHQFD